MGKIIINILFVHYNSYHTPYLEPTTTLENGCLDNIEVKTNITGIVSNYDDFNSSVFCDEKLSSGRFCLQHLMLEIILLKL